MCTLLCGEAEFSNRWNFISVVIHFFRCRGGGHMERHLMSWTFRRSVGYGGEQVRVVCIVG